MMQKIIVTLENIVDIKHDESSTFIIPWEIVSVDPKYGVKDIIMTKQCTINKNEFMKLLILYKIPFYCAIKYFEWYYFDGESLKTSIIYRKFDLTETDLKNISLFNVMNCI